MYSAKRPLIKFDRTISICACGCAFTPYRSKHHTILYSYFGWNTPLTSKY